MLFLILLTLLGTISGILLVMIWGSRVVWRYLNRFIAHVLVTQTSLEFQTLFQKVPPSDLFESMLRAQSGVALERPFGSPRHYFNFNSLLFNPIYLSKKPLGMENAVKTEVVIGPYAKQPLQLNIPIMIGAMSYGNSLSLKSMLALGCGATQSGTAVNSGNGPFLNEVREIADIYAIQLPRSFWSREREILRKVDLIELGLGHSAWASAPIRIAGYKVIPSFARRLATIPGLDVVIDSRLPEVESCADLRRLIGDLKEKTDGVPVAVKFGSSHYIEKELEVMIEAGADVVVFDGITGGTHGSPPILQDDFGLPLLPGLCRAARFIEERQLKGRVSLVVGGGLSTPGDFLKCLALGADAVIIGTAAVLAMAQIQVAKAVPWEPPTGILYFDGKEAKKYDPVMGGEHLASYLLSCVEEMKEVTRTLGKESLRQIDKSDLVTIDRLYSKITGISYMDAEI